MKKLLVLILIALLSVLCVYTVLEGIHIGNFEILGIQGIKEKNDKLDERIELAAKRAQTDYPKSLAAVKTYTKSLQQEKKNYEEMTEISSGEDIEAANQIEKYEYDSLMVKLGRHATSEGADLNIKIEKGNAAGIYNLKFEAEGRYISILDFISAIENDSTLGFKIEDFKMTPVTSGNKEDKQQKVRGTFTCRTIAIEGVDGPSPVEASNETATEDGTKNTNSTTNTNNTTRTTNTTKGNATSMSTIN